MDFVILFARKGPLRLYVYFQLKKTRESETKIASCSGNVDLQNGAKKEWIQLNLHVQKWLRKIKFAKLTNHIYLNALKCIVLEL
jgi:hypothetical protein